MFKKIFVLFMGIIGGMSASPYPALKEFLNARDRESRQIAPERQRELLRISRFVVSRLQQTGSANVITICTHNSRRSHMSQLYLAAAADLYGVAGVKVFSGGTEATAFNPRAVRALRKTGFRITGNEKDPNPRYAVNISDRTQITVWSKVYSDPANPQADFLAIMTCSQADANCPIVKGAAQRISLPFEDPKLADNTPQEERAYDDKAVEIAREMVFIMHEVKRGLDAGK